MLRDIINGFVALFQPDNAPQEDRRRVIRLRCRYSVFIIDHKAISKGTVVDMGLQGLRLETQKKFKPETKVSLVYRGAAGQRAEVTLAELSRDREAAARTGVRCRVSWCTKDKFSKNMQTGVRYADTPARMSKSWVKTILKEIGFDEDSIFQRRKIIRVVSQIPTKVEVGSKKKVSGRTVNLGAGGALLQAPEGIAEGSTVRLTIGPYKKFKLLEISGTVCTSRFDVPTSSHLHGVRFTAPTEQELDLLGQYVIDLLKEQTA